ncbi:hypothetical protein AAY24_06485 [Sedimenticola thiotaurini]|uniref:Uncharacterized protein n=1 Tax=Sedimenticola thiotaurini TaxID=1543721 RepID=A0A0F7JU34_9GAMM|nr:hypothetical protein AAY24_06485 [Sedimenticola thiotaurini]
MIDRIHIRFGVLETCQRISLAGSVRGMHPRRDGDAGERLDAASRTQPAWFMEAARTSHTPAHESTAAAAPFRA